MKTKGKPGPEKQYPERFHFRMDEGMCARIDQARNGQSRSEWIRQAIEDRLSKDSQINKLKL